jgi:hypothetical protein
VTAIEDRIAVCGVGRFLTPVTSHQARALMRKAAVLYGDRAILQDLTFFTTVDTRGSLEGLDATCRLTSQPAPNGEFKVELAIGGSARF